MEPQLPKPPIPTGVDLHDFSFTPIFRTQLFRSAFHARASDAEWRAGVTLWLKSWDQMPAGSLPDDDVELCRLAEFGRDQRTWKRVKAMALHGWYICDDSRLYHRVVAEGVLAAYARRKAASEKGKIGASKRWPLIEGGLSNGTGIAQASLFNGTGIAQAMPGDSNRQGEGEGDRDQTPLPPLEKGAARQRRSPERAERDRALKAWAVVVATEGAVDDPKARQAMKTIGGYSRIRLRTTHEESRIRQEFVDAYRNAGP
jgi:hypothetical protein